MSCRLFSCGMWTLSCGMHAGSSSPTRGLTEAPCIGSAESYPLDYQGGIHIFLSVHGGKMKQEWQDIGGLLR